jgi:alkylhydroperoxidase family enzyme
VSDLSPAGRAALEYARRVSRANPRPSRADFEAVVNAGMSRIAVVEIVAVAALNNFSNRTATLLALPPEPLEQVVRGRLFRVMRPLMAWKMRPRLRPSEPLPEPNDGPCARVVAALAGSPTAGVIRRIIDEALASEILPRRTKVLMLAVIARALGCAHGEAEARQFLAEEGLTSSDVDEILRTLGSRRLDPLEAKLVPFARETVRYQPAVIQQRFRELSRDLSPEQVLETAGIAGLANAVCRLSVVLDAC